MDSNKTITSKQGAQKVGNKVTYELPKVEDLSIYFRDTLNDALSAEKHIIFW